MKPFVREPKTHQEIFGKIFLNKVSAALEMKPLHRVSQQTVSPVYGRLLP